MEMKALSIRQPWSWLIVNGHKDIENRTWRTTQRGTILIHAGQKMDDKFHPTDIPDVPNLPGFTNPAYQRGGIVGMAEIVDCVDDHDSPWFFGPHGFVLANAKPLPFYPCPGKLSFFPVDYPNLENYL